MAQVVAKNDPLLVAARTGCATVVDDFLHQHTCNQTQLRMCLEYALAQKRPDIAWVVYTHCAPHLLIDVLAVCENVDERLLCDCAEQMIVEGNGVGAHTLSHHIHCLLHAVGQAIDKNLDKNVLLLLPFCGDAVRFHTTLDKAIDARMWSVVDVLLPYVRTDVLARVFGTAIHHNDTILWSKLIQLDTTQWPTKVMAQMLVLALQDNRTDMFADIRARFQSDTVVEAAYFAAQLTLWHHAHKLLADVDTPTNTVAAQELLKLAVHHQHIDIVRALISGTSFDFSTHDSPQINVRDVVASKNEEMFVLLMAHAPIAVDVVGMVETLVEHKQFNMLMHVCQRTVDNPAWCRQSFSEIGHEVVVSCARHGVFPNDVFALLPTHMDVSLAVAEAWTIQHNGGVGKVFWQTFGQWAAQTQQASLQQNVADCSLSGVARGMRKL